MENRSYTGLTRSLIAPHLRPLAPRKTDFELSGGLRKPIRCLLCDIYGTLLISASGDVGQARSDLSADKKLSSVLQHYGISRPAEAISEVLHAAIVSEHARARKRGVAYPEVQIDAIWRELLPDLKHSQILQFAVEFEMVCNPVWPMPYFRRLLSACRERNIRLGIISNAQFFTPLIIEWLAEAPLEELGFRPELIFFSYQHGIAKPSERLFQMAAAQLKRSGIDPQQTAYIGNDMQKDICPAKKEGFQTILFAGDARSLRLGGEMAEERNAVPDLIVTELRQVVSSLQPNE